MALVTEKITLASVFFDIFEVLLIFIFGTTAALNKLDKIPERRWVRTNL